MEAPLYSLQAVFEHLALGGSEVANALPSKSSFKALLACLLTEGTTPHETSSSPFTGPLQSPHYLTRLFWTWHTCETSPTTKSHRLSRWPKNETSTVR